MLLTSALPGGVWRILISEAGDARTVDADWAPMVDPPDLAPCFWAMVVRAEAE